MRLASPMILFKPTAILRPTKENSKKLKDPLLPSRVPASSNLLEPLKNDPDIQGAKPRLTATRLSRMNIIPSDSPTTDNLVKANERKPFRALPAISCRVRYARAHGQAAKPSVIASLDIETAPFSAEAVQLTAVDLNLPDGLTEDLCRSAKPRLPLDCRPGDNTVFLFRLTPYENPSKSSSYISAGTVTISVHAIILVSSSCSPTIQMEWKTGVDFSTALNPNYGAPGQSMQMQREPHSLSKASSNTNLGSVAATSQEEDLIGGSTKTQSRTTSMSDCDVSVSVTASKPSIVGQLFSWDVLILNRSRKPRQLSLRVLPWRNTGLTDNSISKSSSISGAGRNTPDTAHAVIDGSSLYVLQKTVGVNVGQVISMSADVRTRYLRLSKVHVLANNDYSAVLPESCFETELRLLPLVAGHLRIEALRVTDIESGEFVDIRDLPDIVARDQ